MAQWYRAQVSVPHDSGLPEDAVMNVWHYMITGSGDRTVIAGNFTAQLDAFYTAIVTYLSDAYDWNQVSVKHFDFLDSRPRVPFLTNTITAGSPASTNYQWPTDVALCLSFQGAPESGANMRRRRGRVYLGPFQFVAADQPMLGSGTADAIAAAANTSFLAGSPAEKLAVYSPYTHHGVPVGTKLTKDMPEIPDFLPDSFHPVTKLWVDNAFDTQRRRGWKPTYRKIYGS